jgi:transposase InsO family protein
MGPLDRRGRGGIDCENRFDSLSSLSELRVLCPENTGIIELKYSPKTVSMDGRGRALDNVFVERLWRSVKYEEVYSHDYATVTEAILGLKKYFLFYNTERQHQSLDYRTPQEVYEGRMSGGIKTLCAA